MKAVSFTVTYFLIFSLSIFLFSFNDKPAYKIFSKEGEEISYVKMLQAVKDADVILFGELHNNSMCHWLELSVVKDLYKQKKKLILGAEMLESDDQLIVDNYLSAKIQMDQFRKEAKVWNNFETDYQPMLEFAADKKINFIATSIPRKYASLVAKNNTGVLDSLSAEEKKYVAPLPIEMNLSLPGYKALTEPEGMHGHSLKFLAQSQAVKDATMAYFIAKNFEEGKAFLHVNGAYHSDNYEGITWYLKRYKKELKVVTISSVEQEEINKLDKNFKGKADFIICIPSDMTKTY